MIGQLLTTLIASNGGIIFSTLLQDTLLAAIVGSLVWKVIIPARTKYGESKYLDKLCGSDSRHWFYGHMLKYSYDENGLYNVFERAKSFPRIFNTWIGPLRSDVTVYHPDTVQPILGSNEPKNENGGYYFLRPWIGDGLLTSKGKKWHRNRRLLTPAFHYSILHPYLKVFNEGVQVMLSNWEKKTGNSVEVTEDVSLMTLDTMLQCAMSFKSDCQNVDSDHSYIEAVHDISSLTVKRFINPIYLFDCLFFKSTDGKKYTKAANIVHKYAEKIIKERKEMLKKMKTDKSDSKEQEFQSRGSNMLDFLDILLQTKDEDGVGLSDREIRDEVDTFLFEGHDTTASAISWAIYNLAKHPEYQEKCRSEVVEVVGDKGQVEWNDLSNLHYLTMFIKESMRLYATVPTIGRMLNKSLQISQSKSPEMVIPTKTTVLVHILALHRNEQVWPNPTLFDPERFTKENISKRPAHAYVPFSAGPRNCIGQNFAMNEIKVVLSQIIRKYHLYLDDVTPEPIMDSSLVLRSKEGIHIKFKPTDV